MKELICETPLWEYLKESSLPIVLYGMGNGADMIIDELSKIGLTAADIFASDGFVRGHYFRGYKVLTLKEVEEKYDEFIILLTFAVHDEKMLSYIKELSGKHILFAPTVPIAGKELFTFDYIYKNDALFDKAYSLLADNLSKKVFTDILNFKVSGKTEYLFSCESQKEEVYSSILKLSDNENIVDLGAYDGDTIREFLNFTNGKYNSITAFEPDEKNFRKLETKTAELKNIQRYNLGAWDKKETILFDKKSGRNSKASDKSNVKSIPVKFDSVDNVIKNEVSFIKMDIEGAELKALEGAKNTIIKYKPKLYVCAYHRNEDFFSLILKINELFSGYKIYLRHHPYVPSWETNIYAVL